MDCQCLACGNTLSSSAHYTACNKPMAAAIRALDMRHHSSPPKCVVDFINGLEALDYL